MLTIDRKYCTGCKVCEKNCPTGAIKVIGGKAQIDNNLCNLCYRCVYACTNSAIKLLSRAKTRSLKPDQRELLELSNMLKDLEKRLESIESNLNKIEEKGN